MFRNFAAATLAIAMTQATLADTSTTEQITPGSYGAFADGTWDCRDATGTYLGAVVIADLSYAFINPDQTVGTYGKLNKDDWIDMPAFFVLSGELKDRFGAMGMSINGPEGTRENMTDWSKNQLKVVITAEQIFYCDQRRGPAG